MVCEWSLLSCVDKYSWIEKEWERGRRSDVLIDVVKKKTRKNVAATVPKAVYCHILYLLPLLLLFLLYVRQQRDDVSSALPTNKTKRKFVFKWSSLHAKEEYLADCVTGTHSHFPFALYCCFHWFLLLPLLCCIVVYGRLHHGRQYIVHDQSQCPGGYIFIFRFSWYTELCPRLPQLETLSGRWKQRCLAFTLYSKVARRSLEIRSNVIGAHIQNETAGILSRMESKWLFTKCIY